MSPQTIKAAAVQQHCTDDKNQNLDRSEQLVEQAVRRGAQLVVLQELHGTAYFCQIEDTGFFDLAESIPGPTTERLTRLAKKLEVVIVGSVFERRTAGIYHNTAVVIDKDGSLAGIYRKMHIPDDPGFYEKFYFTPGDADSQGQGASQGFKPIDTSLGRLGVLVCWDQWFPEAARLMALQGADCLIYPTAIGWDERDDEAEKQRQLDAWTIIQRSHAVANNLPVIVPNRIGHEKDPSDSTPGIQFWGHSFICGPQGEILCQSDTTGDAVVEATLNWENTDQIRKLWPYLRDRRIDAYHSLNRRFIDEY